MNRQWNHYRGPDGSGTRYAQALAAISTESYVNAILGVCEELHSGATEVRIRARRRKVDVLSGEELPDDDSPGDFVTLGYGFGVDYGDTGENFTVDREPEFEGEQTAADIAYALAMRSDRGFCEAMVQTKCLLDRIGGILYIKPLIREETLVGFVYHFEHVIRGDRPEPAAKLDEPKPLPGEDDEDEQADEGVIRDEIEAEVGELLEEPQAATA